MLRRRAIRVVWAALALTAAGCTPSSCNPPPPSNTEVDARPAAAGASADAAVVVTGPCADAGADSPCYLNDPFTDADREAFFHLSEGSEIFPYSWLLALQTPTGRTLFDPANPGYGLHADPAGPGNDAGAPIGMTVDATRDTSLIDLQMFGFNCAACHVGELHVGGHAFRILGAPSLFDINSFVQDFKASVAYTLADFGRVLEFIARVLAISGQETMVREPSAPAVSVMKELPAAMPRLSQGKAASQAYAAQLRKVYDTERARAVRLGDGLRIKRAATPGAVQGPSTALPPPKPIMLRRLRSQDLAAAPAQRSTLGPELVAALKPAAGAVQPTGVEESVHALQGVAPDKQASALSETIENLTETVDLLQTRLAMATALAPQQTPENITAPGPGRVDAFNTAHNALFPNEPFAPMTAPVSYPALWGLAQKGWFHWDGNTTSFLLRNVGQAIGLGAVVDTKTDVSTVRVDNIERLEELAARIPKPAWPFAIDTALAAEGATIFAAECQRCHQLVPDEPGLLADDAGLDPQRAESFAMDTAADGGFKGEPYYVALRDTLLAVATKESQAEDGGTIDPGAWRRTREYVERPLDATWATAPYLHNGSQPTLAGLLTPGAGGGFSVGAYDYDTALLGYVNQGTPFDPTAKGNGRAGHPWGTALPASQKTALLEYMKSL